MEAQLIAEVARWPVLYDTSLEDYKHVEIKNHAWRAITYTLFHSTSSVIVERVKNKWKNLRDTFVKSQRKKDKPNSRPWKLEEEMKFLIPHINPQAKGFQYQNASHEGRRSPAERSSPSSPEQPRQGKLLLEALIKRERSEEEQSSEYSSQVDDGLVMQHVETVMEDSPRALRKKRRSDSFSAEAVHHFLDLSNQPLRLEQGFHYQHVGNSEGQSSPAERYRAPTPERPTRGKLMTMPPHSNGGQLSPAEMYITSSSDQPSQEKLLNQYDAIDSYFLGLAQTVKRLKPVNQVLLKKAISNMVFDAELKETEAVCEATSSSV